MVDFSNRDFAITIGGRIRPHVLSNLSVNSPSKLVRVPTWRIVSIIVTCNRVFLSTLRDTIERGSHPSTRHTIKFSLPVAAASKQKYSDKAEQKRVILELRALGWSYRDIANEVGLHWTRVGQILKQIGRMSSDG